MIKPSESNERRKLDQQVRRLFKLNQTEKNFGIAAMKVGMDEKTARKYRGTGKLPGDRSASTSSLLRGAV